jgi:nucleoside-diphosphate-sugar epimerase
VSRALVLGGSGPIGLAVARRLLAAGWEVDLTGRDPAHVPADITGAGARFLLADRAVPAQLMSAMGPRGADLLVDCLCYTADDAASLVDLAQDAASTVMISSKAVYVDSLGNHSNSPVEPHFDGPVRETQPTVAPGGGDHTSREGYAANKVAAEQVLLSSGCPVTVLRPSKIHGEGALRPREWVFVKRALDRRPAVLLAHRGAGIDHTTAAANIAALIEVVATAPGRRILNSADPDAPSALDISRSIAGLLGHTWEEVLLDEDADPALGRHPWERAHPFTLDMGAADALGYIPVGDYATTVGQEVRWLVSTAVNADSVQLAPGLDVDFFSDLFDYPAEDRYLAARGASSPLRATTSSSPSPLPTG